MGNHTRGGARRWLRLAPLVFVLLLLGSAAVAGPRLLDSRRDAIATVDAPAPSSAPDSPTAEPSATPSAPPRATVVPATRLKRAKKPAEPVRPSGQGGDKDRLAELRDAAEAVDDATEEAEAEEVEPVVPALPAVTFRVASFNVLGSSHTRPDGNKPSYADGRTRIGWTVSLLRAQGATVAGFQEYEPDQHHAFMRRTGGSWGVFPGMSLGTRGVRNSVAWNTATWQRVEAHTTTIPYFRGTPVLIPYVLLEHRQTGRRAWFISIHNPVSSGKRGNNQHWRNVATQRERALMAQLRSPEVPVLLVGDFNERAEAFCKVTAGGAAEAANGGSGGPPCRPPADMHIDWIFGTPTIDFSAYLRHQNALVRRTSDHPMILATATVPGG